MGVNVVGVGFLKIDIHNSPTLTISYSLCPCHNFWLKEESPNLTLAIHLAHIMMNSSEFVRTATNPPQACRPERWATFNPELKYE